MDLAAEIGERALEVIRGAIEAGAAAEKEAAAQRLLRELEEEDAGKKVRREGFQGACQGIAGLPQGTRTEMLRSACRAS